jgi:hypothetical protein
MKIERIIFRLISTHMNLQARIMKELAAFHVASCLGVFIGLRVARNTDTQAVCRTVVLIVAAVICSKGHCLVQHQGILKGEYHCTVDLLFDRFGISCMTTDIFCFYLQNRLIQTSQTGGQWYSDTSPFSIP